ncbi:MAG: hypothetical protein JWR88_315 [Pseudonocardia sp.]|nr:hypothetical protein [Pseudonocardia sp.]
MSLAQAAQSRVRVARRAVASVLVLAGAMACVMSLLSVGGGLLGSIRLFVTIGFLILGPGWAAAGFLRRAPAAHVWLLTVGTGVAVTLLIAQIMVMTTAWQPAAALYLVAAVSMPVLARHAVVAQ